MCTFQFWVQGHSLSVLQNGLGEDAGVTSNGSLGQTRQTESLDGGFKGVGVEEDYR